MLNGLIFQNFQISFPFCLKKKNFIIYLPLSFKPTENENIKPKLLNYFLSYFVAESFFKHDIKEANPLFQYHALLTEVLSLY